MSRSYTLTSIVKRWWAVTDRRCDACKVTLEERGRDQVTVSHRRDNGSMYGGSYIHTTVDLCHHCFTDRLLPLLKREMGITAQVKTIPYEES